MCIGGIPCKLRETYREEGALNHQNRAWHPLLVLILAIRTSLAGKEGPELDLNFLVEKEMNLSRPYT